MKTVLNLHKTYEVNFKLLKVERLLNDLSTEELAKKSNVHSKTIQRIEKEKVNSIQYETLKKLSDALNKDIEYFLSDTSEK